MNIKYVPYQTMTIINEKPKIKTILISKKYIYIYVPYSRKQCKVFPLSYLHLIYSNFRLTFNLPCDLSNFNYLKRIMNVMV